MYFVKDLDKETRALAAKMALIVFGESAETYLPFYYDVFTEAMGTTSYEFMPMEQFTGIKDIPLVQQVYWTEILYRAHLAAITSILRHLKWIDAVVFSASFSNWFAFAASFRGLLESFADSTDALREVPEILTHNFRHISDAIEGKATKVVLAEDFENRLIHYTHARKGAKGEKLAPELNAKQSQQYLTRLLGDTEQLRDLPACYADLCQITHPAAHTVHFFFDVSSDEQTVKINNEQDMVWIMAFCRKYQHMMYFLFQKSFNLALLTLKILNRLPILRLRIEAVEILDFSTVAAWQKLEKRLK